MHHLSFGKLKKSWEQFSVSRALKCFGTKFFWMLHTSHHNPRELSLIVICVISLINNQRLIAKLVARLCLLVSEVNL